MPWDFALILFVLGVLVPWRGSVRIRELLRQPTLSTADRIAVYASTIAFQWFAAAMVLWRATAHAIGFPRLGIALPHPALAAIATSALLVPLLANQFYGLRRLARLPPEQQGFLGQLARKLLPQNLLETLAFIALACTVAVCEEVLYRGFVFTVLYSVAGGSLAAAVLGSASFFSLAHLYQGPRGLLATFVVGLLLAAARVWTASLAPCIITHLVVDLAAGLAAPRLLRVRASPSLPAVAPASTPGERA